MAQGKKDVATVLVSGGMDSVTLAYLIASGGMDLRLVSLIYGQRHVKEVECAAKAAKALGAVEHLVVDISEVGANIKGNALTDAGTVDVPHGHYESETMLKTVVPGRNAIFLSIACGIAASHGDVAVATAVHAGDHAIYPDCRSGFIARMQAAMNDALEGLVQPRIYAPFLHQDKGSIAAQGKALKVPYRDTWTCYEGGEIHCGQCGACVERQEAVLNAGITEDVEYAHPYAFNRESGDDE